MIDEVEPFLLRSELLIRTPRGRRLTARGFEHLGVEYIRDDPPLKRTPQAPDEHLDGGPGGDLPLFRKQ